MQNCSSQKKPLDSATAWRWQYWHLGCVEEFVLPFSSPTLKDHTSVNTCRCPFFNIGRIGYINPTYFFSNSFIYETLCSSTVCPYAKNVTQSTWKCVTVLVKKNVCQNLSFGRNYFPGITTFFSLNGSWLSLSLFHSAFFEQMHARLFL